ncbi:hypothetical protein BXZ70DRAFT_1064014 [Cristinia sonorae]|uniref:F-box domain-containing protein n=1 Tax=Cristinia sonorae TaxID=1940300 RepID=A0A8K0UR71_9AGAR|nr:hypothetical protein BXZ70DRAFT_1064014 [Cristinia sonorae]
MHRVFYVAELVELMVEAAVDRDTTYIQDHGHLAPLHPLPRASFAAITSLALTCKLFREPCLNAMWHTQISLVPLFRSVGAVMEYEREYILRRPLHEDYSALLFYSSRIRVLDLTSRLWTKIFIDQPIIEKTLAGLHSRSLFPSLHTFRWGADSESEHASEATLTLRNSGGGIVDFESSAANVLPAHCLQALYTCCPNIQRLCMAIRVPAGDNFQRSLEPYWGELGSILCAKLELRNLRLVLGHDRLNELWHLITDLPRLETLGISAFTVDRASSRISSPQQTTCPLLKEIHVQTPTIHTATLIFQRTMFPSLQTLSLTFDTSHISIENTYNANPVDFARADYIRGDALRPLLRFGLTSFHLGGRWSWDLDDAILAEMAQAWPRISLLSLDTSRYWKEPRGITLRGLESLLRQCPELEEFCAVIDSTPPATISPDVSPNGLMTRLDFGYSPIERDHIGAVAELLFRWFPNILLIETYNHDDLPGPEGAIVREQDSEQRSRWFDVEDLVLKMARGG